MKMPHGKKIWFFRGAVANLWIWASILCVFAAFLAYLFIKITIFKLCALLASCALFIYCVWELYLMNWPPPHSPSFNWDDPSRYSVGRKKEEHTVKSFLKWIFDFGHFGSAYACKLLMVYGFMIFWTVQEIFLIAEITEA